MNKIIVAALLATAAAGASAQAYVSGAVGVGRTNLDCNGVANCDKTGTAFKLVGGYGFGNNLSAELGYLSFGKAKASDATGSIDIKSAGIALGLAYRIPASQAVDFTVRGGIISMKTKLSGRSGNLSGSVSDTNVAPYVGVGVGYALTPAIKLDAGLDLSRSKFDKNGLNEKGNVQAFTVGATFAF
ncbi:outer membrane beta-barrel protein [Pelomonas sp. CA6]|mgnify:CR=1 FL=1|uniref:outer membrane beta-barrel protein n=1 Tax=Pelomonas sp. CA6 TaxID=2907999 RepID=UPI001F4BE885|nr:outer membrane beta-barrel protein [Pelomonas sp. CA6]MCH7343839.1 outer membrane beta-barrel protein [Pelomonas sp. CA6]